jgi:hypothetical protein
LSARKESSSTRNATKNWKEDNYDAKAYRPMCKHERKQNACPAWESFDSIQSIPSAKKPQIFNPGFGYIL